VEVLAARVRRVALRAAASRSRRLELGPDEGGDANDAQPDSGLGPEQTRTELGDVAEILRRGPEQPEEAMLLSALLALGLRDELSSAEQGPQSLAAHLVWLASHTSLDALEVIDAALGARAEALWPAVARVAVEPGAAAEDFGRAEALIAAAAVGSSGSPAARQAAFNVASQTEDPLLRALLLPRDPQTVSSLRGELQPAPTTALRLALLTVTGILLLWHLARLVGRLALGYRRPAELSLSPRGLELRCQTELLGRVLHDRETLLPLANLARVTREVRYARAGLYAGLAALAIGTYFGVGLFVDGVRVPGGSPPLLGMGLLIIIVSIAIDFGLSSLADTLRGKCRVVVVPRKGRSLCVGGLDPRSADAMLLSIAKHPGHGTES
jgi:hypothetical protein